MRHSPATLFALALVGSIGVGAAPPTAIHEAGRCAIRGQCGGGGFVAPPSPCVDNEKAAPPSPELREELVKLCGQKWQNTDVCCDQDQVGVLKNNLGLASQLISGCPACKENFYNLFCTFTCSPDQSLFVNVTKTVAGTKDKLRVTELENLWSTQYQSTFYDSCKEVKNGVTGGKVMDLLGGGAKNYSQFVKYLGDKKFGGSPFQINFIEPPRAGMKPVPGTFDVAHPCNDTDPAYRCSCVDCPDVCPTLGEVTQAEYCRVGRLPCLSFAVIIVYSIGLVLLATAISGHVWYARHKQRKSERLQLLQDAAPSDDEDEGDLVHNAGLLDRPTRNYHLNQVFDRAFSRLGKFCAKYPGLTIGSNVLIIGLLSLGWLNFEVERDPVRLWVSPTSDAAQEKEFYDSSFGPFYRTEQVFLTNDTADNGIVLTESNLNWWFEVERHLSNVKSEHFGLTFQDVCFKPVEDACVIQSVQGWFPSGLSDDWQERITTCSKSYGDLECLPAFMDPLKPGRILGGYDGEDDVLNAKALFTTWVVQNHPQGSKAEAKAIDWERMMEHDLLGFQEEAAKRGLRLSFSTEQSLEKELNKSTNTDAKIVVVSYVVMFIYASLALGAGTITLRSLVGSPSNAIVQSKFTLGVVGILIVLMSVSGSVGLFSAAGVKVTLIIAEVIPFLVLAVGVDNIFLIVHEFERVNLSHPDEEIDDRIAKALGRMGPSIFLSASTETFAFAMGAAVGMPAVKNFAAYAAGAVFINAVLQVTMFVSVLALNQRRVESLRADCFPCITVRRARSSNMPGGHFFGSDEEGVLQHFIRKTYAPALMDNKVKTAVMTAFVTLFAAGIAMIPEIQLGLDQRVALPDDSYMVPYFNDLDTYFGDGPPVYFVTRDVNLTQREMQQKICSRFTTCDQFSLGNILEQESHRPDVSYIGAATANWVDDMLYWLAPDKECCTTRDGSTCLEDGEWHIDLSGMPTGRDFVRLTDQYIHQPISSECPTAGSAPYGNAVVLDFNHTTVPASHFRTSHTPLHGQDDYINSYLAARRISDDISERHDIDVFPYSKHYIFFDQYVTIIQLTATLLAVAVGIIFVLTSVLLGSLATGAVISLTTIMILVDIMGVMALAQVSLNAISLVNLLICVGISVEFCAHIARAFTFPSKSVMERAPGRSRFRGRDLRAWTALVNVGGSVFSGITVTKFLGVCVLAFTRSKIFEIYYFRVWLALVCFASAHALVFLPVALSFFGGAGYIDPESEGGLEEDLASRRYRSLLPDGEGDWDSDDE